MNAKEQEEKFVEYVVAAIVVRTTLDHFAVVRNYFNKDPESHIMYSAVGPNGKVSFHVASSNSGVTKIVDSQYIKSAVPETLKKAKKPQNEVNSRKEP